MSNHQSEHSVTPPPPPPPGRRSLPVATSWSVGRRVSLAGAAVGVIGSLLPWATMQALLVNFSVDGLHGDGKATIVLFGIAGVILLTSAHRATATVVLVLSSIATLIAGYDIVNISNFATQTNSSSALIQVSPGIGIYLCVLGGAVSVIGAAIDLSK